MKNKRSNYKTLIIIIAGFVMLFGGLYKLIFDEPGIIISPKYQYPIMFTGGEFIVLGIGFVLSGLFFNKKKSEPKLNEKPKKFLKHH